MSNRLTYLQGAACALAFSSLMAASAEAFPNSVIGVETNCYTGAFGPHYELINGACFRVTCEVYSGGPDTPQDVGNTPNGIMSTTATDASNCPAPPPTNSLSD